MELFEYLTIHNRSKTHKNIANKLLNMNISTKELTVRYQEAEQHKHLMRQANLTFEGFFTKSKTKKDYTKAMEKYDDAVYDAIMKNKSKKLLHSIISNKYSHR